MLSPRLMLVARRLPLNLASVVLFGLIPYGVLGSAAACRALGSNRTATGAAAGHSPAGLFAAAFGLSESVSALQSAGTGAAESRQLAPH